MIQQFYELIKETEEGTLYDNATPDLIALLADVVAKYLVKNLDSNDNLQEFAEKMNLNQVFELLPGINTEDLDVNFLKSLFVFKGTKEDLEYLLKLAGINMTIEEYQDNYLVYGDDYKYGYTDNIYGGTVDNLHRCKIVMNSEVNIDTFQGIIDLSLLESMLKKILENRLYFCTAIQYIKIRLLYIDQYDYTLYTVLKSIIEQNWKDTAVFGYGNDLTYGSNLTYGDGLRLNDVIPMKQELNIINNDTYNYNSYDNATYTITKTINLEYGNNLQYGNPITYDYYKTTLSGLANYGDNNVTVSYTDSL